MECKHERVECTNGIVRCLECGRELPIEFLTGGEKGTAKKATAPKPDKASAKKKTGGKAE